MVKPAGSEEESIVIVPPEGANFGKWLDDQMSASNVTIPMLAEKSGITYVGIWNIVNGNTISPRKETRDRLAKALHKVIPKEITKEAEEEATLFPGFEWVDFTPSDLETVPEAGGIYVFYDITDRPVYVGRSDTNVRGRVKDHQTRFWFKEPLVVRGAFLSVTDGDMCRKIEIILIRFLGKHALLNQKGVVRDIES